MSSQLPVPSKAALTALRGLVVGTSCTLVLVTEDRRRRINAARSAISNAEKIKSAKQYNSAGAAFALVGPDEDLSDAGLIRWKNQDGSEVSTQRRVAWMEISPEAFLGGSRPSRRTKTATQEDAAAQEPIEHDAKPQISSPTTQARSLPAPITPLAFISPITRNESQASIAHTEFGHRNANPHRPIPTFEDSLSVLFEGDGRVNLSRVDEVIAALLSRLASEQISPEEKGEALQLASKLVRKCHDAGLLLQAQHLLAAVIKRGPLLEEEYYTFMPLEVVRSTLKMAEDIQVSDRPGSLERLKTAITLFLPTFPEKPRLHGEAIVDLAKRLIQTALDLNDARLVDALFWRVTSYFERPVEFTQWFISALHKSGQHKRAIKFFLLCYSKMQPDESSFPVVGDMVVEAVDATHGFKAKEVLTALLQSRPAEWKLKTRWVTNLLYCHWQRRESYDKTTQLFRQLTAVDADSEPIVTHLDALYRVMIQISIEAGEEAMAESYFAELVSKDPAARTNPRLLGLLALQKAKNGDWVGVRKDFEAMDSMSGSDRVFVPILKEYAKNHAIQDTEKFMRMFLDELHVPLSPYMVTLIAKEYGRVRDVQAFINWIDYCTKANINADAALSHAILVNCRQWGFGFEGLQDIYSRLQRLNPNVGDDFTDRLMLRTTYSGVKFKYDGTTPQRRVRALNIKPDVRIVKGRTADQGNVYIAMKQALVHGNPRAAGEIFTRAIRRGMPYCERCFKLAIQGSVAAGRGNIRPALDLLLKYQQAGRDISVAILPIFESQLSKIDVQSKRDAVMREVTSVLEQFEAKGISLTEAELTRAAMVCLEAKHFTGAISLGLAALRERGEMYPCHPSNFFVLLSAYVGIADSNGVEWAIQGALDSHFGHSKACMKTLKVARARLKSTTQTRDVKLSLAYVKQGIIKCQSLQERLELDRKILETETMRIMQTAAEEAGYLPAVSMDSPESPRASSEGVTSKAPTAVLPEHATRRDDISTTSPGREIYKAESFNRPIAVGGGGY